jgi:XRE family transcriptional regulator, regulator of sulfur utilization
LNIGPRLRAARESLRISVRALAQKTGFSPSFLSQVELGQSSPSLASLQRICAALDIEMTTLLQEPSMSHGAPVLRRSERESLRSEWSRASAESLLPPGADERLTAMLVTLDPGGRTGSIPRRRGSRDFAYCARGRVALMIGEQRHQLGPGDSVLIEDTSAVSWENTGRSRAEVLLVSARLL